jgi:polycystin 1L2
MLDRIIAVSTPDIVSFNTRLSDETQTQMTEHHLWLSLFMRPQQSKFTRVQRLSCILALLCLIMISNAMFFQSSDEIKNVDQVTLGPFKFSFSSFYVSCIGILISTPPVIFAAFVFRHVRSRKSAAYSISDSQNCGKKCNSESIGSRTQTDGEIFKAKRDKLPHWVYYLAWIVIALAIVSSSFFLVLYSMEWGKAKSEEWLLSFAFSFLESLIIVDPAKVIFLVMILTTILRHVMQEDSPTVDLTKLRMMAVNNSGSPVTRLSGVFCV